MDYVGYRFADSRGLTSAKIVVAGGFGVGKSTFIRSIVDADLLTCTTLPPERARGVTQLVSIEFGRVWLDPGLALHLFCAPHRQGPRSGWDDVVRGAVGAVVLLDRTKPADSVDAMSFFDRDGIPYVIALNSLQTHPRGEIPAMLKAMGVGERVPVVNCDPRYRHFVRQTLITLVEYAKLDRFRRGPGGTEPLAPVC